MASTLSTNAASSTFLQSHPELAAPGPSEQPSLSLRPDTSRVTPPLVNPPGSDLFPDTFHEFNLFGQQEDLAAHLLVVYNSKDPDSEGLARYYAGKRNIPDERVMAIASPTSEEITRDEYEETIRRPIVSYLAQKGWLERKSERAQIGSRSLDLLVATRNDIWAIVLMRGVPLKIASDPTDVDAMEAQPELQTNAAAVDSELAMLPVYGAPKGGYVPNVFFDDFGTGIKRIGPELAKNMIMVTRLDGPTTADVRRMIDDCLYAEEHRLAGLAVVDTRGLTDLKDGYTSGDIWLRGARDSLVKDGWTVKFDDRNDLLPPTDPCNEVAIYEGWYSQEAFGPWVTPPTRFVPGAIAYHLHSFSAATVRADNSHWVGPLIAHGADATMGMVYEPYLALTPHMDIFTRRMLQGAYFAEAAYASERGLSWMLTVVGDPLYRPFRVPLISALDEASTPRADHDDWLLLQKTKRDLLTHKLVTTTENLKNALDIPGTGPVAAEGLGDMLEQLNDPAKPTSIEEAYKKALAEERAPVDRIRVGLKLAQYYSTHGEEVRAQKEIDTLRELCPDDAARFGLSAPLVPTSVAPASSSSSTVPPPSNPPPAANARPQLPQLPQLPKPTPDH
jgi:uncharacterized protein (TIGR03790 family)